MKKLFIAVFALVIFACGEDKKKTTETDTTEKLSESTETGIAGYLAFGEEITTENALSHEEMYQKYQDMKVGDTIEVKFSAPIASVCKKKGCWMKVKLDNGELARVDFKDYAFFVPKDIEEKEVVMHGKAYIKEISVDALKHYAEDAGKSEEEIAAITEPELTLSFTADGVLVEE